MKKLKLEKAELKWVSNKLYNALIEHQGKINTKNERKKIFDEIERILNIYLNPKMKQPHY